MKGSHCTILPSSKNVYSYPQLAVINDSVFIVLLNIVREVVDGDVVVLDILHDLCQKRIDSTFSVLPASQPTHTLLEDLELTGSERVGLSNDGDDIDTRRQTAHKFDINFAKTERKSG